MDTLEKVNLAQRTRARNVSLWFNFEWGGLLAPVAAQQAARLLLSQVGIESAMAISDEVYEIKEAQRDQTVELEQYAVRQETQIADLKVATGRQKLAIQKVTDEYILAAMTYDAKVKNLLMGAQEYAAQVELEQLAVSQEEAQLAVDREGLRLTQVNAQIYFETVNQAMVKTEIARYQVQVAKAQVQVVLADIAAGEADIKVLEAQIQQYVAEADKAMLQAQVAQIYAQIMLKQLSAVKLDVGTQEIAAGFKYIQARLTDMLSIWDERVLLENLRSETEQAILDETNLILTDEKVAEDLREMEVQNAQDVQSYTETQTAQNIEAEKALKATQVTARNALADARMNSEIQRDAKHTWAQELINIAQRYVYLHALHQIVETIEHNDATLTMETVNEFIEA